jgi:hypothetical protein
MLRNIFEIIFFSILLFTRYSFGASFSSLDDYMNWDQGISGAMVSDDASTIVISYGSGGNALWKMGTVTQLIGFNYNDMTPDGSILAGTKGYGSASGEAFIYQSGTYSYFGNGTAMHISNNGTVVAGKNSANYDTGVACIWINGVREDLGYLSSNHKYSYVSGISGDGRTMVGLSKLSYYDSSDHQTFIWSGTSMEQLPGPEGFTKWYPQAVSYDGSIVTGGFQNGGYSQACIYHDGSTIALENPDGYILSYARDMTADGSIIIGDSAFSEKIGIATYFRYRAVIWDEENGARLLQSVLEEDWGLDLTGWILENAIGISEDGSMVYGTGIDPQGIDCYWIAQAPEPATVVFLGLGSWILVRRKKHDEIS